MILPVTVKSSVKCIRREADCIRSWINKTGLPLCQGLHRLPGPYVASIGLCGRGTGCRIAGITYSLLMQALWTLALLPGGIQLLSLLLSGAMCYMFSIGWYLSGNNRPLQIFHRLFLSTSSRTIFSVMPGTRGCRTAKEIFPGCRPLLLPIDHGSGTKHNMIVIGLVFFFHVPVHDLRAVYIFLVIVTAYMQLRYLTYST